MPRQGWHYKSRLHDGSLDRTYLQLFIVNVLVLSTMNPQRGDQAARRAPGGSAPASSTNARNAGRAGAVAGAAAPPAHRAGAAHAGTSTEVAPPGAPRSLDIVTPPPFSPPSLSFPVRTPSWL